MYLYLNVSDHDYDEFLQDYEALLSLGIRFPIKIKRYKINVEYENPSNHRLAMADYSLDSDMGMIWFFDKYFKVENLEKRLTIFLHELIHIHLFALEEKMYNWKIQIERLRKERIEKEMKEERYPIDLANYMLSALFPETLKLPFHISAERFFYQKYPELFNTRIDAYYDRKLEWFPSFLEWKKNFN